ncbi:MAG: hypothetical protein IM568_07635 [Flavobacterium sp.]|nr:hypothetical protein [Flavobacterium sp.]
MIDKMIRCKNLKETDTIETIHEWFYKCTPKGKEKQWKDGRSAKETAKHWVHTIPKPFLDILKDKHLRYEFCSPEYVTKFDAYKGEGRNHDLLILAKDKKSNPIIVSIESKADEPFGETIEKRIYAAEKAKNKNDNSKAKERIKELWFSLFGEEIDLKSTLKYQLLTAVAGTIAEAKKRGATTAYFLIQTFIEQENNNHQNNKKDLDNFIKYFSKSVYTNIENNKILGPFSISKGTDLIPDNIELFIGKYEVNI